MTLLLLKAGHLISKPDTTVWWKQGRELCWWRGKREETRRQCRGEGQPSGQGQATITTGGRLGREQLHLRCLEGSLHRSQPSPRPLRKTSPPWTLIHSLPLSICLSSYISPLLSSKGVGNTTLRPSEFLKVGCYPSFPCFLPFLCICFLVILLPGCSVLPPWSNIWLCLLLCCYSHWQYLDSLFY